jgi:hypothetical protein
MNFILIYSSLIPHPSSLRRGASSLIREQLVNQKVQGRSSGVSDKRAGAKPKAKRSHRKDWQELMAELRELRPYLLIAGIVLGSIIVLALLFVAYRTATHSAFFQLKEVNIVGAVRTSSDDVKNLTRRVIGKSGVWNSDIDALRREIEKLPWVRSAIVSRVLPDGIRVRVTEREARAVVRLSKDRFVLVDEEANILATATSKDKPAPFILRGWDEATTDSAKKANRERVNVYGVVAEDFNLLGLSSRVREVNLSEAYNVRALVAFNDSTVEFRLGNKDFGNRLKYALEQIEVERGATDFRCIAYVDVTQGINKGDRLAFGTRHNCLPNNNSSEVQKSNIAAQYNEETGRHGTANNTDTRRAENKKETNKNNAAEKNKTETTNKSANTNKSKNDKKNSNTKSETRPRKV